jgi:predicted acetyltransferase
MPIEIRTVPADQMRRLMETVNVAFGEPVDEAQWQLDQALLEPERALGAYDGDRMVGGGAAFSFRMTVPGGAQVRLAGVTGVGVMPTHRRRGILRSLMARQLADVRANGEPLAALVASEGSIYQRFGYGLGLLLGAIDIERERAAFRTDVPPTGSIRLVDKEEARRVMPLVYEPVCAATPGFIERDPRGGTSGLPISRGSVAARGRNTAPCTSATARSVAMSATASRASGATSHQRARSSSTS